MSLYQGKGLEELQGILSTFEDKYKERFGSEFNIDDLARLIKERQKKKEAEAFESTFGTMTPGDLAKLLKLIDERKTQPAPKPQQNQNKHQRKAT